MSKMEGGAELREPREWGALAIILLLSFLVVGAIAWLLGRAPGSGGAHAPLLPSLNASLNAATTVCLLFGWRAIRRREIDRHRGWMLTAVVLAAAFLTSYVVHHLQVGSVRFEGPGWLRLVYLGVLLVHVVLSAAIVPLVMLTLWRAWRGNFARHREVARWTLPLWLVVSVTGVVVYAMVYHLSPIVR
ncbi:MAG: DUF420 domain-containing protein [Candidatus Binatia bacterium]|nr:DUF420 domain-containing protein [Candidatus Binatia bacterium]